MDGSYYTITEEARRRADDGGTAEAHVRLTGELDLGARDEIRDALLGIIDQRRSSAVRIDLSKVTFIDSEALGALISGYVAAAGADVTFTVHGAQGVVRRVLEIVELPGLLGDSAQPDQLVAPQGSHASAPRGRDTI